MNLVFYRMGLTNAAGSLSGDRSRDHAHHPVMARIEPHITLIQNRWILSHSFTYVLHSAAVVNGNNLNGRILSAFQAAEVVPANAAKAIDGDLELGGSLSLDGS